MLTCHTNCSFIKSLTDVQSRDPQEPSGSVCFSTPRHAFNPDRAHISQQSPPNSAILHVRLAAASADLEPGGDLEGSRERSTKESCSDAKDVFTSAHSKRKAQNRAAYVWFIPAFSLTLTDANLNEANEPSASAKNSIYKISKPNFRS